MKKVIYLDNAATTKVRPEVVEAMLPYFTEFYGNPSSVYEFSTPCKKAMAHTREVIADALGAKENEIYFTNGGTESDNWALKAAAEAYGSKGKHIITTQIEHHAVLHTGQYLEKNGFEVTYLPVDENGLVNLKTLKAAIRPDTILISVMFANNEIGTIEPIKEIGEIAKEHGILFHTDAVQAFCHEPINVDEYHIDMLSASAHKFNGPKGVGFLYIRNLEENKKKETELRDYLVKRVMSEVPYTRLNGHPTKRLSNNANFAFQFIEGESLLIMLDMEGICGSAGSACTSGSLDPSHVLLEIAHGSLRLTLSHETAKEDIDDTVESIKKIVERLRSMSPLYEDFVKSREKREFH